MGRKDLWSGQSHTAQTAGERVSGFLLLEVSFVQFDRAGKDPTEASVSMCACVRVRQRERNQHVRLLP